ncbi:motility associated factor glycosyltransferase family protein [Dongshaea marina]|uniref:motility associated factor glycosyltransferase family protein n=1 Tax=Dongshaea marina TaxID=2047966 RepID=UPI000D3E1E1D|nr:6-hydroxymethylpterin diphosphokinase MptE-like protein [Dongshaea marina]
MDPMRLDIETKILRGTFVKNLAVLKKHMPPLFELYKDFEPQKTFLTFDHNDELNLVSDGGLVYEDRAQQQSCEQAELYLKRPMRSRYLPTYEEEGFEHYLHIQLMEELFSRREEEIGFPAAEEFNEFDTHKLIDFLCMIGSGLGYHIQRIFDSVDVNYFFLYEPDPECFYACLHVIDWQKIIEHCNARGGTVTVTVGGSKFSFMNNVHSCLSQRGTFHVCRIGLYRHYHSEDTDESFEYFHELAHRLSSGWGFFEDEILSTQNTFANIKINIPLLKNNVYSGKLKKYPVFIIGNGPSLDYSIDYIKNNLKGAIVISGGTATRSLLENGIVPDIHVEVERTYHVAKWLENIKEQNTLSRIPLVAFNNVHPEAMQMFERSYMILKPHDSGNELLCQLLPKNKYNQMYYSNPTVTNFALALAFEMKMTDIYLFGTDFGYKDKKYHHSRDSAYYDESWDGYTEEHGGQLRSKANFGDDIIFTESAYESSRAIVEMLIERQRYIKNRVFKVHNTSDGAKVEGAEPATIDSLPSLDIISNKQDLIFKFLDKSFSNKELVGTDMEILIKEHIDRMRGMVKILFSEMPQVTDIQSLINFFQRQYAMVIPLMDIPEDKAYYRFLKGTLNYIQTTILTNAYFYHGDELSDYSNWALLRFKKHCEDLVEKISSTYHTPQNKRWF